MKSSSAIVLLLLLQLSVAFASPPTFQSLNAKFKQQALLSLASNEHLSTDSFNQELITLAANVFKEHSTILQKESMSRFNALPSFESARLASFTEHKSIDSYSPPLEQFYEMPCFLYCWDPSRIADFTKMLVTSPLKSIESIGQETLLRIFFPDEVFKLEKNKQKYLVVESLSELFITEIELTEDGVFKPISIKWFKGKRQVNGHN